jgi:peroxiredoxin family protein
MSAFFPVASQNAPKVLSCKVKSDFFETTLQQRTTYLLVVMDPSANGDRVGVGLTMSGLDIIKDKAVRRQADVVQATATTAAVAVRWR